MTSCDGGRCHLRLLLLQRTPQDRLCHRIDVYEVHYMSDGDSVYSTAVDNMIKKIASSSHYDTAVQYSSCNTSYIAHVARTINYQVSCIMSSTFPSGKWQS